MSENNDTSSESNSRGETILQASRFTSGLNNTQRSGVLRPSVLGSALNSNTVDTKAPDAADGEYVKSKEEVAANPFLKEQKDNEDEAMAATAPDTAKEDIEEKTTTATTTSAVTASVSGNKDDEACDDDKKADNDDDEPDERPDPLTLLCKNGLERSNMFAAAKNSIPRVEKSGFVFGQNVHERVVVDKLSNDSTTKPDNSENSSASTGELLFSSVIQNAAAAKTTEGDGTATAAAKETTDAKSLNDVAREYEESRVQKRKYEEVETFTGEENEVNIVDVSCKLFAFVNSNWEERGRGSLRLNDSKKEQECSRVVFRTSGNLRLLVNTKVWAGMVAERPSQKSLRLTAMDNTGKLKIFLVMGRPADMSHLHKALVERVEKRKISHPEEGNTAVLDNNGDDADTKNGNVVDVDEAKEAAAIAEPEHDDSTEPSPKKALVAAGVSN